MLPIENPEPVNSAGVIGSSPPLPEDDLGDRPKKRSKSKQATPSLSGSAHALASVGPATESVVYKHYGSTTGADLFEHASVDEFSDLATAFRHRHWTDEEAAKVVEAYASQFFQGHTPDLKSISRWVLSHPNDAQNVIDCMTVDPPEGLTILRLLSRAGSQKLVFLASWRLAQRQVVLKRLTGPPDVQSVIAAREAQSHPLSMSHRNIIETHYLKNEKGDLFFVEQFLHVVLGDDWRSPGLEEASNLLFEIADALTYLHEDLKLVHGDVKPDNIGKRDEDFVLLDFGICRPISSLHPDSSPTGSLRTRAPELLASMTTSHPEKADVWAIGASVYNALTGRYPLFRPTEKPPRHSTPEDRNEFASALRDRASQEYEKWVDFSSLPEPIRPLLENALQRDPSRRWTAKELRDATDRSLSAFLRQPSDVRRFSLADELRQLISYLPSPSSLRLMPLNERQRLHHRLHDLRHAVPVSDSERLLLESLISATE